MKQKPKLELEVNQPTQITLIYNEPLIGKSQYGEYYLYAVRNGDNETEYSFFAPSELHEPLKVLKAGNTAIITKSASQKGSKLITNYSVEKIEVNNTEQTQPTTGEDNTYFGAMLKSFEEALKIQEQFNGMVKIDQVAISLFIARTKVGGLS